MFAFLDVHAKPGENVAIHFHPAIILYYLNNALWVCFGRALISRNIWGTPKTGVKMSSRNLPFSNSTSSGSPNGEERKAAYLKPPCQTKAFLQISPEPYKIGGFRRLLTRSSVPRLYSPWWSVSRTRPFGEAGLKTLIEKLLTIPRIPR